MSAGDLDVAPGAGAEYRAAIPSGRGLRRLTRKAADQRVGDAGIGSLLSDLYYSLISWAIAITLIIALADRLGGSITSSADWTGDSSGLSLATVVTLIVIAVGGVLFGLAARLGPVGLGGAQAVWWMPTPVDRRSLLRPTARRLPLIGFLIGLGAATAYGFFVGAMTSTLNIVCLLATGALSGLSLVLLAALLQSVRGGRRIAVIVGDTIVLAAPLAGVVLAATRHNLTSVPIPGLGVTIALLVFAVAATIVVDARLGRLRGAEVRERGAVAEHAAGAATSMDTRELGRALSESTRRARRLRSSRFRWVRGAKSAIFASDVAVLLRSPRHLIQIVAAACVPAIVAHVAAVSQPLVLFFCIVVTGYAAMLATAEGARRAEMAPILDRIMPLEAHTVRKVRMIVPGIAMLVWSIAAFASVGSAMPGALSQWIVLGVCSTPVWAGAAVRSAYRPAPDWSAQLVATPTGALPTGVLGVISRGPDVTIVGLIPVGIALLTSTVNIQILLGQIVLSLIAVWWSSRTRTLMETAAEQQKILDEQKKELDRQRNRGR